MMNNKDIYGSLVLNIDQAAFKSLVETAIPKLAKYTKSISLTNAKDAPGYVYQDYVVTIKVSHDKKSYEVYRNRTSVLVYAMINGKVASINYEYVFIEDHLKSLMKESNG